MNASLGLLAIGAPVMIGLSFFSEPIVRLVLGSKWSSVGPLLQWMALILAGQSLQVNGAMKVAL